MNHFTLTLPSYGPSLRALRPSLRSVRLPVRYVRTPVHSVHCATPSVHEFWPMRDVPVFIAHPRRREMRAY